MATTNTQSSPTFAHDLTADHCGQVIHVTGADPGDSLSGRLISVYYQAGVREDDELEATLLIEAFGSKISIIVAGNTAVKVEPGHP
jgi:hypothetical protein